MSAILDFKKSDKTLYSAPAERSVIVDVPKLPFAWISGQGDPNGEAFAEASGALYAFSYALRMSDKNGVAPEGFVPYTVGPLEGEWSLAVGKAYDPKDKSALGWTIMIRQPNFLDKAGFLSFRALAKEKASKKKDPTAPFDRLEFGIRAEGLCAQILHLGPYDAEPSTFARMEACLAEEGYARLSKDHREIYLSDPRKTAPEKLKTILRVRIRNAY